MISHGLLSVVVVGLTAVLFAVVIVTRGHPNGAPVTARPKAAGAHAADPRARPTPEGFEVRELKSPMERERDDSDEMPLDLRQEIFAASRRNDEDAVDIAETLYPTAKAPKDAESLSLYLAKRESVAESNRLAGRETLLRRYRIDASRLTAIEREGTAEKWPSESVVSGDASRAPSGGATAPAGPRGSRPRTPGKSRRR